MGEKYALLVGINDYQNDIGALKYCVADVEAFGQALVETAGFNPDHVYLMTSQMTGRQQPTHVNVIRQLSLLSKRVKPEDTFIFYFSGHGITKAGQSFLLTTNSDTTTKDTLTITAVDLNQAKDILSRIQAQQLLIVIDACRNDPDSGRGEQDNLLTNDFSRGFKIKKDQANAGTPGVSATLYACAVGERAYEWPEKQHGVFSYYLLEGLNGKAANSNGEVVVTDLADYTQRKVMKWAQEVRGKKQTPWLDQSGGSKLVLIENQIVKLEREQIVIRNELEKIQQQIKKAESLNNRSQFEAQRRRAELQEKVRKNQERIRQENEKKRQKDERERQDKKNLEREAERRLTEQSQAKQKQEEIKRKQRQLEIERQKLKLLNLKSMNVDQLFEESNKIHEDIQVLKEEVQSEIKQKIDNVPFPDLLLEGKRGEYESTEEYRYRRRQEKTQYNEKKKKYDNQVRKIKETENPLIEERTAEFRKALSMMNREIVLNETVLSLVLGEYDADDEVYDQAKVIFHEEGAKLPNYSFKLKIPKSQARSFKENLAENLIKIQAHIEFDAEKQLTKMKRLEIEDVVQNLELQIGRYHMRRVKKAGSSKLFIYGVTVGSSYPILRLRAELSEIDDIDGYGGSVGFKHAPKIVEPLGSVSIFIRYPIEGYFGIQSEIGWNQLTYRFELSKLVPFEENKGLSSHYLSDTIELQTVFLDAKLLFQYRIPLKNNDQRLVEEIQFLFGPSVQTRISLKSRTYRRDFSEFPENYHLALNAKSSMPNFGKLSKNLDRSSLSYFHVGFPKVRINGWVCDLVLKTGYFPSLNARIRLFYGYLKLVRTKELNIIPQVLIGYSF